MKRKISIIGSTGSIGTQALEVIEKLRDKFEIIALAGGHNKELLAKQAEKFKPKYTSKRSCVPLGEMVPLFKIPVYCFTHFLLNIMNIFICG